MCGIFGYIGQGPALNLIVEGLKRLEYRGYDSWGIVTLDKNNFYQAKRVGHLNGNVTKELNLLGTIGIGHTRWATHGEISERNAHPLFDCRHEIALVHNGVIYNGAALRDKLLRNGHLLTSDTDSELFAHLIEEKYEDNRDFIDAMYDATSEIDAQYAFLILNKKTSKIYVTRKESPLKIGIGEKGNYVSSDILSLVGQTEKYVDLEDGDIAEIGLQSVEIYDKNKKSVKRDLKRIDLTAEMIDKGEMRYFYLKETKEEKEVVNRIISSYITDDKIDIGIYFEELKDFRRVIITGAGSSFFASMIGDYYLKRLTGIVDTTAIMSSEVIPSYYETDFSDKPTLLVAVTQSGETKDTLNAIKFMKQKGVKIVTLVNRPGSESEKESDCAIKQLAGPELSVVATKSFLAEVLVLLFFSIGLARVKSKEVEKILKEVKGLPILIDQVFSRERDIEDIAKKYQFEERFYPLSRGINIPVALEIGRKMEEILYVSTIGTSLGSSAELKHGPLTMVTDKTLVFIAPFGTEYKKIITNVEEAKARRTKVIVVATEGDDLIKNMVDDTIWIPKTDEFLTPILSVILLQLLTYYIGIIKEMDSFDKPRNLAKSITVD